jgi:hypothetical protein
MGACISCAASAADAAAAAPCTHRGAFPHGAPAALEEEDPCVFYDAKSTFRDQHSTPRSPRLPAALLLAAGLAAHHTSTTPRGTTHDGDHGGGSALRRVVLGIMGGGPISMHIPFSTVQLLTWHSHLAGRPPPLARLSLRMRSETASLRRSGGRCSLQGLFAALRCQLACLDLPAPAIMAPMDSLQGETSRTEVTLHHSSPPVQCLAECVDAAPQRKTTAYSAEDAATGAAASGFVNCIPHFHGGHVTIGMHGCLQLRLGSRGAPVWRCTVPSVNVHLLPTVRTEFTGTWHLWCASAGLAVEVTHHPRGMFSGNSGRSITGRVMQLAPGTALPLPSWTAAHGPVQAARVPSRDHSWGPRLSTDTDGCTVLGTLGGTMEGSITFTPAERAMVNAAPPAVVWCCDAVQREEAAHKLLHSTTDATMETTDPLPAEQVWQRTAASLRACRWGDARAAKQVVDRLSQAAGKRGAECGWTCDGAPDARERCASANFVWTSSGGWQPRSEETAPATEPSMHM